MLTFSAPGKLILSGEYAVLRGAPALVAAVDRRVSVALGERAPRFELTAAELGLSRTPIDLNKPQSDAEMGIKLALVLATLRAAENHLGSRLVPRVVTIDSMAFYSGREKLGFGSSAAVCMALYGALMAAAGEPFDGRVFPRVLAAHRDAQGAAGSGFDVAASLFGGFFAYRRDHHPEPLRLPEGARLLAVFSGQSASTPSLVSKVLHAVEHDTAAAAALDRLEDLATACVSATQGGDGGGLRAALADYHDGLERLGRAAGADIVTAEHACLASSVNAAGGAYKPAGAGGGDIGVAFCANPVVSDRVSAAVEAAGFSVMPIQIAKVGLCRDETP